MLHAGVIDEDVDRAGIRFVAVDGVTRGGGVGHVEGQGVDLGTLGAQFLCRLVQPVGVAGVQHQSRPGLCQPARKGETDAHGRPGNEGRAARQIEQLHSSSLRRPEGKFAFPLERALNKWYTIFITMQAEPREDGLR